MSQSIVAVTGASGHVGANLVRALLAQGRHVRVLEHRDENGFPIDNAGYKGLDVEVVEGDVRSFESLDRLCNGVDVVYHLAARISLSRKRDIETERVNIEGSHHIARACLNQKVKRLIYFSSIHALSAFPLHETIDERRPFTLHDNAPCYDLSKAKGTIEIQKAIQAGLDAVILYPCAVVGPYDFMPSAMGKLLCEMSRKRLLLLCEGGFNWIDVRDVVQAALAAEKQGRTGEGYLLSGEWLRLSEIANIILRHTQKKSLCWSLPAGLAHWVGRFVEIYGGLTKTNPRFTSAVVETLQHYRYISNEKAKRELGFSPRPIEETIIDALTWHTSRK